MATIRLPPDFKEFFRLLNAHHVEYLLIGGYAVGYHGYPRATVDMDIWVAVQPANAERLVAVLKAFSFNQPDLKPDLFLKDNQIVRLGVPPVRIEIVTTISGVRFEACHAARFEAEIDGVTVPVISLKDLKANKKASGRHKDLDDLEHLL
jgi:hypothetical protein